MLFRHGDRSPTHTYPNDPYQEEDWPQGFGQLTQTGKREMYEVGRYIRSRYIDTGYLTPQYMNTEIHMQSTDKDRTLMSASLVLAGLYPPDETEQFHPSIAWQPIPVHTVPLKDDYLLAMQCTSYDQLFQHFMKSPQVLKIQAKHQHLINYVAQHSGLNATLIDFLEVMDPLNCETKTKKTLPKWLHKDHTVDKILQLQDLKAMLRFNTPSLARIKGGPLLGRMLQNMEDRISNENMSRKAFLFSAHDTTINAFLNTLRTFNGLIIPTGTSVYVELHVIDDIPVVQLYYRNNTNREPYLLDIPDCPHPCSLSLLGRLSRDMIPTDPKSACDGILDRAPHHGVSGTTVGVAVLTAVIVVGILVMLGINALREKHRQTLYRYSPVNQHM